MREPCTDFDRWCRRYATANGHSANGQALMKRTIGFQVESRTVSKDRQSQREASDPDRSLVSWWKWLETKEDCSFWERKRKKERKKNIEAKIR